MNSAQLRRILSILNENDEDEGLIVSVANELQRVQIEEEIAYRNEMHFQSFVDDLPAYREHLGADSGFPSFDDDPDIWDCLPDDYGA